MTEPNTFIAQSTGRDHHTPENVPVPAEPSTLGVKTTGESTAEMVTEQSRTDLILPRTEGDVQSTGISHRNEATFVGDGNTQQKKIQDRLTEMSAEEPT